MCLSSRIMDIEQIPSTLVEDFKKETVGLCHDNHLLHLKALTERLQLETRRPTYQEWRTQLEGMDKCAPGPLTRQGSRAASPGLSGDCTPLTCAREFGSIDDALVWLRKELVRRTFGFVVLLKINGLESKL